MAKPKKAVVDKAFLSAALEGLELQRQRIELQIRHVKSLLGRTRSGNPSRDSKAANKPGAKRELSEAARKRIAIAQKRRWAKYRKAKNSAIKGKS